MFYIYGLFLFITVVFSQQIQILEPRNVTALQLSGNVNWNNPSNVLGGNAGSAMTISTLSGSSRSWTIYAYNFGFNIPNNAAIVNISVVVRKGANSGGGGGGGPALSDNVASLYFNGNPIGPDQGTNTEWGAYQNTSILMRNETYTGFGISDAATINDPTFGFGISCQKNGGAGGYFGYVDSITIIVSFNVPTTSPVTSSPLTTGSITTGALTSGSMTTNSMTTNQITSGEMTTSPITTSRTAVPGTTGMGPVVATTSEALQSSSNTNSNGQKKSSSTPIIAGAVAGGVILIGIVIALALGIKLKKRKTESEPEPGDIPLKEAPTDYAVMEAPKKVTEDDHQYGSFHRPESVNLTKTNKTMKKTEKRWEIKYSELQMKGELGRGSFGIVFWGIWRNGDVAVKQLINGNLDEKQLESFLAEVEVLSHLRPHSNIVQFQGACIDPKTPYCIVTEYLPKGNLYDYLRKHSSDIDDDLRVKWIKGIGAGMRHLQDEGIIHRDLAARNVLLSGELVAKISDFGMSRFAEPESGSKTQSESGPLKWMSPELLLEREYGVWSDVWSFGVVIYEIYTATDPYPELPAPQAAAKVVAKQLTLTIPEKIKVEKTISKLFSSCLSWEKKDRPNFHQISDILATL